MPAWLTRQRWLLLVATAFSLYLAVLLVTAFRSQEQLRDATEARLLTDNQQLAIVLGDFLSDQRMFVLNLADSHEIETFLTNKALGMSMRYGLNANLYAIEESFRRKLSQKVVLGTQVYNRILYFDETGELLVDTTPGTKPPTPPALAPESGPELTIDGEHGRIVAATSVDYRGQPGGTLMTVANLALLSRYLNSSAQDLGMRQLIIDDSGRELTTRGKPVLGGVASPPLAALPPNRLTRLESMAGLSASELSKHYDLVLRVPIAGAPIALVTILPTSALYGHITSRRFLYFATAVPFVLVLTAFWYDRMRQRTERLEADVRESNRNREELRHHNDALKAEIERRETLERQLRESQERYRTYIEHAPEGIFVADATRRFIDANPAACTMVGFTREELVSMTITDLAPRGLAEEHAKLFKAVQRNGPREIEMRLRRKDDAEIIVHLRAVALPDGIVLGFCLDITARKRAEEQIHTLAYFDPLTGLPNRRLLMDRLRQAMVGSGRERSYGALFMLDLDHFKDLNDTQGHDVGDQLLTEVATRLTACVRRDDTVARVGGDEFLVVAKRLGPDQSTAAVQAELIAEKVHQALGKPYALIEGRLAHYSNASIGVALFHGQEVTIEVLLKQADVALYQAKNAGRDTIRFFNPEMQATIDARAAMEAALRDAIRRRELQLYYQPQVNRDGRITGAEALLRWLPPSLEPIPPDRFIPVAEETGLILPIGAWALAQGCARLAGWQKEPATADLTLSLNVSARQFHQPDFVAQVWGQIKRFEIDPAKLKLELTESALIDRVDEMIERLHRLKGLGVGISLDDFGTGYSSLSYLKRLPLDEIKIDQSFVRDITHDQNDAAIVRAILAMSRSLGLDVIAEGVETQEQRAFLLRHGCEHYQGYLFGRPGPIEDFPAPLAGHGVQPAEIFTN
ncbi:PAS domain S-box/diguanylate cyclase (GGDEF) domain-containing protein [Thioflavicoccus mobilis 8321]|uniref:cyclic-guanylate-specific phosphodiesterase n=1 Tax=Thioflavicoccus mobilis 8321 TaxID=765912 RepID=L0H0M9_9GAMM|nr:EAL domain-containing protein [Thioflavicoccus mobilis]AGA91617.1 PAS domain S-box/diguanylate cyclase (GGDEF) domain-containing protein [Thioflavicoccus mobilis 8321]